MAAGSASSASRAAAAQVVEAYGCTLVEGVLSHQLKRFIIDGNKCVLNRPLPDAKAEDATFEENEVYALDIVVSTGEGKSRVTDEKETTVRSGVRSVGSVRKLLWDLRRPAHLGHTTPRLQCVRRVRRGRWNSPCPPGLGTARRA